MRQIEHGRSGIILAVDLVLEISMVDLASLFVLTDTWQGWIRWPRFFDFDYSFI